MNNRRRFFSRCALFALLLSLAARTFAADPVTGVYRLTTRGQQGMCLDVDGFGNSNGTPVQLWAANKTSNQQWLVERQGDGAYKLYAYSGQNSLQMLDYAAGATGNGTNVATWEDNGGDAQRWYFREVGGGWYRIIPKNAGPNSLQTLDMRNGNNAAAGSTANLYTYYGGDNQVFRLDWAGVSRVLPNPKKGIGGRQTKTPALNASWYYTWGADRPSDAPSNVEFVPMEWGYYDGERGNAGWLNWVKSQPGVQTILAFNEPDSSSQANLSVNDALIGYRFLAELGIPIGSPATVHADNQWMRDFMNGAAARGYRVDYVTIHWYGGVDPQAFLNHVEYIHNLYGKPVWITEFCPADWSGQGRVTAGDCAWFMRQVLPELNRRWYVQRYAWYTGDTPSRGTLASAALVNDDGTLTDLGRLYSRL